MLQLNPGLILWTIITFLVVAGILAKTAWKPLVNALHAREEGIRKALQQADEARKEAERTLAENRVALARANEETARILREGRELAEKMRSEIVLRAHESAKTLLAQAKEEIEREKESALTQLRDEVAELAVLGAEKILDERLDASRQRNVIDNALQKLPKN